MSGIIKIDIMESEEELLELLKQAQNQEVKERILALYWLKTGQVESVGAIAALVGKHRTTVSRWLSRYRQGGINGLLVKGKSSGRQSAIAPELEAKILQELEDPEGFSSYSEVQRWLEVVENVKLSYSGVHKLIRYRLKAKLKIPRPVHVKQKEGAVEDFKKN
jgi:putative transposase